MGQFEFLHKNNNKTEIGRWDGIKKGKQKCKLCGDGIEDEIHYLIHCIKLNHIRR